MSLDHPRNCTFTARLDCHYLVHAPDEVPSEPLLIVTLHGFGGTPADMLRLTGNLAGEGHVIASLQGPYQFYLPPKGGDVGYCWATNRQAESSIRLHHEMVLHVLNQAGREFGIPCQRRVLAGFSQPVSLNYRFAATFPEAVAGVLALCGGVPGDWETSPYRTMRARILHIARNGDEYYPPGKAREFPSRLRLRAADVEFHMIDGPHRFPSKAYPIVAKWLRHFATAASASANA
jgi:predicted esterase